MSSQRNQLTSKEPHPSPLLFSAFLGTLLFQGIDFLLFRAKGKPLGQYRRR